MSINQHSSIIQHKAADMETKKGTDKVSEIELGMLQMQILWLLSRQSMHGYDLMRALTALKSTEITQGTLYPTLKRLQQLGLIKCKNDDRRIMNSMTAKGKRVMNEACLDFVKTFYGIFHDYACRKCGIRTK